LKREGQAVTVGEAIAEVETDKTSVELEAPASGVLERIAVSAGTEGVPVGSVLAVITHRAAAPEPAPSGASSGRDGQDASSASPLVAKPEPAASSGVSQPVRSVTDASVSASPLALRMAKLAGIDLNQIAGGRAGSRSRRRTSMPPCGSDSPHPRLPTRSRSQSFPPTSVRIRINRFQRCSVSRPFAFSKPSKRSRTSISRSKLPRRCAGRSQSAD
jgi:pyruvate/2-oxoglutarate dehydrogenase complex dihydrolipoamide acyltransferase (E2) component